MKKKGRPTDFPKNTQKAIRFDDYTLLILTEYCNREKISFSEAVRRAVRKLKDELE